jgi:hypothetical protein
MSEYDLENNNTLGDYHKAVWRKFIESTAK